MSGGLHGRRIGLLTACGSRLGGGVFEAVVAQADLIRECGGEPHVFSLMDAHSAEDSGRFGDSLVTHCPVVGPAQIGFAPALVKALLDADLDCLHLHGIWMYPSRAGLLWARRTGRAYIVSPHGMLDPWITARGKWKKALARNGYERRSWRAAHVLHALTGREAGDIARETGRGDSLVIPNCGPQVWGDPLASRDDRIVYIGRIHAKKNLLALVAGWGQARRPDGARLIIAGWGADGDVADVVRAVAAGDGSAEFVGPVYGEAKRALLGGARFAILPSLSEGLPMAVLEGWAAATPAIMTAECNLPEGFAQGAALECGFDAARIAGAIERAFALAQGDWQKMAGAALGLATGRFARATVTGQWVRAYQQALATGGHCHEPA